MGATLANNGRSEEAIDAYHKALELRPSFVRARYNIGVSCVNIGCYKEAAEHILTGLSMHKRGNGDSEEGVNVSSNSWEMLRKAFIMMVSGKVVSTVKARVLMFVIAGSS